MKLMAEKEERSTRGASAVVDEPKPKNDEKALTRADDKAVAKAEKTAKEETEDEAAKVFKVERKPAAPPKPGETTSSSIVTVTIHSDDELFNQTLITLGQYLNAAGRPEQAMKLHDMMHKV